MRLVGQAGLFQHDRDLDAIGGRQGIELEPVGMLGGPLLRDRKCRKIVHRKVPWRRSPYRNGNLPQNLGRRLSAGGCAISRYLNARTIVSLPGAFPRERRAIHRPVVPTLPRKRAVAFLVLIPKNSELSRGTIVHQKFSSVTLWLFLLPALCSAPATP